MLTEDEKTEQKAMAFLCAHWMDCEDQDEKDLIVRSLLKLAGRGASISADDEESRKVLGVIHDQQQQEKEKEKEVLSQKLAKMEAKLVGMEAKLVRMEAKIRRNDEIVANLDERFAQEREMNRQRDEWAFQERARQRAMLPRSILLARFRSLYSFGI